MGRIHHTICGTAPENEGHESADGAFRLELEVENIAGRYHPFNAKFPVGDTGVKAGFASYGGNRIVGIQDTDGKSALANETGREWKEYVVLPR